MEPVPGSFEEGAVVFRKLPDDTWVVEGCDLTEGQEVTVHTKSGEPRDVIITEILETAYGVTTARFRHTGGVDPAVYEDGLILFTRLDDDSWGVRGLDLVEGEEVPVTTKDGDEVMVVITEIVGAEDNLVTARFEYADRPTREHVVFRSDPYTDGYLIQGPNLTEGQTVPVIKKSGKPVRVVVGEVLMTEEDGTSLARFTWPRTV